MQEPIRLRDRIRLDHVLLGDAIGLGARGVDDAVDDGVGDVDALGAELAGEGLGEGAEGELHGGKGGEEGGAFGGGGGAGEEEGGWGGRVGGGVCGEEEEGEDGLGEEEGSFAVMGSAVSADRCSHARYRYPRRWTWDSTAHKPKAPTHTLPL